MLTPTQIWAALDDEIRFELLAGKYEDMPELRRMMRDMQAEVSLQAIVMLMNQGTEFKIH
jgi:hypothetical protein